MHADRSGALERRASVAVPPTILYQWESLEPERWVPNKGVEAMLGFDRLVGFDVERVGTLPCWCGECACQQLANYKTVSVNDHHLLKKN